MAPQIVKAVFSDSWRKISNIDLNISPEIGMISQKKIDVEWEERDLNKWGQTRGQFCLIAVDEPKERKSHQVPYWIISQLGMYWSGRNN